MCTSENSTVVVRKPLQKANTGPYFLLWYDSHLVSVSHFGWDNKFPLFSSAHAHNAQIPSFDDFTHSNFRLKRLICIIRRFKLGTIQKSSRIMSCNCITFLYFLVTGSRAFQVFNFDILGPGHRCQGCRKG